MNGNPPADIRTLSLSDLENFFREKGEKSFRARQVYDWIWKKSCRSFDEMTSLSRDTRQILKDHFSFRVIRVNRVDKSKDGTLKTSFRLYDNLLIEGVLIPVGGRTTACISTQVGCHLACRFCATGQLGFKRNLTFPEIFDQVVLISGQSLQEYGIPLSNIVYMGMGEPLLNYENVIRSIERITSPESLGFSPQRITLSTVGIPAMIRKLADDQVKVHLALSLHAASNRKRSEIIPVNKKYPLEELTEALKYYHHKTRKRITIEFILFGSFNDTISDAADLAVFCRNFPVKINIIEYNPIEHSGYSKADQVNSKYFVGFLENKNLVVNVRKSRGTDIEAACGQLALKEGFVGSSM